MSCYALACRQVQPCASDGICERVWHACDTNHLPSALTGWMCGTCGAWWVSHHPGAPDVTWRREPLTRKDLIGAMT